MKNTDKQKINQENALNRRQFVQILAGITASLPSSVIAKSSVFGRNDLQSYEHLQDPWLTLASVQEHLLPANKNSPGARDITALHFLQNLLNAPDTEQEEHDFILQGVNWLNQLSIKHNAQKFNLLDSSSKEKILREIETSRAGSRWLSLMMTYLIEALLSDPVYGGNKNQLGWKWLEHIPGFPTPTVDKVYFKLGAHASPRRVTKA